MKWLMTIHRADVFAFTWCMRRHRRALLTAISHGLSRSADGPLYGLIVLALMMAHTPAHSTWIQALVLALIIERSLYFVLKNGFRRNRPQEAIDGFRSFIRPSDQFSFPSGHTSCAFLFAVFLAHLFPVLSPVLMVWAASIGFARVFLGVHFPTDTLMGALLGSSVANLTMNAMGV